MYGFPATSVNVLNTSGKKWQWFYINKKYNLRRREIVIWDGCQHVKKMHLNRPAAQVKNAFENMVFKGSTSLFNMLIIVMLNFSAQVVEMHPQYKTHLQCMINTVAANGIVTEGSYSNCCAVTDASDIFVTNT